MTALLGRRPIDELAADPAVRAVVVTGEGSAFCSGGNTSLDRQRARRQRRPSCATRMMPFYRAWLSIRRLEVPTIAAVNGPAIGAGLCLALACDLRYAAAGARLGAPFVRLGMHAGMAGTYLLPDVVGEAARPRPAAHRPHRRRRRGAAARPGLPGARRPRPSTTRCSATADGIAAHRAGREPAHQGRRCATAATPTSSPPAVGGAGPADHAGHRGPAGGHRARPGRSGRRSSPGAERGPGART